MNHHLDTIAAQATAAGEGGIAIVRVSGSRCEESSHGCSARKMGNRS